MGKIVPKEIKTCAFCGRQFFTSNRTKKYCDSVCSRKAERERVRQRKITINCVKCGKEIVIGYKSSRVLCDECREKEAVLKRHDRNLKSQNKNRYAKKPVHYDNPDKAFKAEKKFATTPKKTEDKNIPSLEQKKLRAKLKVDPSKLVEPYSFERNYGTTVQIKTDPPYEDMMSPFRVDGKILKAGESFTEEEDLIIKDLISSGETYTSIAITLGRTPAEIRGRHLKNAKR